MIDIQLDGDNCWTDLDEAVVGQLDGVALLPDALTHAGTRVPAVTLRIRLDGQVVLAQIKVDALRTILGAVDGRLAFLAAKGHAPH